MEWMRYEAQHMKKKTYGGTLHGRDIEGSSAACPGTPAATELLQTLALTLCPFRRGEGPAEPSPGEVLRWPGKKRWPQGTLLVRQ